MRRNLTKNTMSMVFFLLVKTHAPFWHTHCMLNCVAAIGAAVFVRSSGCAFLIAHSHRNGGSGGLVRNI